MPREQDFDFRGRSFTLQSANEVSDEVMDAAFRRLTEGKDLGPGFQVVPRQRLLGAGRAGLLEAGVEVGRALIPRTRREVAELAGATAGALVAPQVFGPAIAARRGGRVLRGLRALQRPIGAGLGAGTGAAATGATLSEAARTAAFFGVGETTGLVLNKALLSPFSGSISREGRQALQTLRPLGVRPTPGQATSSLALDLIENISASSIGGKTIITTAREKAAAGANKVLLNFRSTFRPQDFSRVKSELYDSIPNFSVLNTGDIRRVGQVAAERLKFSKDSAARSLASKASKVGETSTFDELQRLRSAVAGSLRKTATELDPALAQREMSDLLRVIDGTVERASPNARIISNWRQANELVKQDRVGITIERFLRESFKEGVPQGKPLLNRLQKLDEKKARTLFGDVDTWNDFKRLAEVLKTTQGQAGVAPGLPLAVGLGQLSVLTGLFGGEITVRTGIVASLPLMALALSSRPTAKLLTEGIANAGTREGITALSRLATFYLGQEDEPPPRPPIIPGDFPRGRSREGRQ